MEATTLSCIKREIAKFLPIIESIAKYWKEFPQYTLISVLVQNAAHDSIHCFGYNHDDEVAKLKEIVKLLKQLKDYHNSYLEEYVYNEVSMIVEGNEMDEWEDLKNESELNSFENQSVEQ
jgi:hypothetical protein